jgi:hypothetical protein
MAEQRDLSLRAITVFAVSLAVTILTVLLVAKGLFGWMLERRAARQPPPLPVGAASQLPPEPRLQVHAPLDLERWRAMEQSLLTGYGWVDRDRGVARIPIARAMKLIEDRGLQPRKPEGAAP